MQDSLYPLNSKDIESIGKGRANRNMPQNVKYWLYGGLGVAVIGFFFAAMGGNQWVGVGIVAVGAVGAYYSTTLMDKYRKKITRPLKQEWLEEQERARDESHNRKTA